MCFHLCVNFHVCEFHPQQSFSSADFPPFMTANLHMAHIWAFIHELWMLRWLSDERNTQGTLAGSLAYRATELMLLQRHTHTHTQSSIAFVVFLFYCEILHLVEFTSLDYYYLLLFKMKSKAFGLEETYNCTNKEAGTKGTHVHSQNDL